MIKSLKKYSLKRGYNLVSKPLVLSNERAKLSLNFRKSSRYPIFVQNTRWASPTRTYPDLCIFYLILRNNYKLSWTVKKLTFTNNPILFTFLQFCFRNIYFYQQLNNEDVFKVILLPRILPALFRKCRLMHSAIDYLQLSCNHSNILKKILQFFYVNLL